MVLALALATLDMERDGRRQLALVFRSHLNALTGPALRQSSLPYTDHTALPLSHNERARCKKEKREANKYAGAKRKTRTDERRPELRRKETHERRERLHATVDMRTAVSTAAM
jgi:hypothetical protein